MKRQDNSKNRKPLSVNNEAIFHLMIRLIDIDEKIDYLDRKTLSKWDVAQIVILIIAEIAAVVGATYSIIKLLGGGF